jgi:hypothetical protein
MSASVLYRSWSAGNGKGDFVKTRLLPDVDDPLVRGRAGLVIVTCLGLVVMLLALFLLWLVSGDLQGETVVGGLLLGLILVGIVGLARTGRVGLATWLLIILLVALITVDVAAFGLGSPAAAAYFVPVVLAACGSGLLAGISVALFGSVAVWIFAWLASVGWYEPWIAFETSHLTFNAPFFTALLLLIALIVGFWVRHVNSCLQRTADSQES